MRMTVRTAAILAASLCALCAMPAWAGPPEQPRVIEVEGGPGVRGGEMRMLIGREKDTRLMVVYGYARLVGYDRELNLVPDILEAVEVEDGRTFTFTLRAGHKWSDGHPFTSEDFRYWWEDVANNEELMPFGLPTPLLVDGKGPTFEVVDERTVRYSWEAPNPFFLPALAAATPVFVFLPAHYMKQFHKAYLSADQLAAKVKADNARDWVQLHFRRDRMYEFDNPDLPTLQPWQITTAPPNTRFVLPRNENFHRVDQAGQQLPYTDRVILEVVDNKLIPIKAGAGETDLQGRGLSFSDYTFLLDSAGRSGMVTTLWRTATGAHLALYPNLNAADPVMRELVRDVRFRRALSLAVDRDEINQTLFYGLGIGGQNTVLPQSPLFQPEFRETWAQFDPEQARALLDEMGLKDGDGDGVRELPDGRALELVVETAGEDTEETDVLQLVHDQWRDVGIKIYTKPSQREVLRNRVFSGEAVMTISAGLENGIPSADMPPTEFVPVEQIKYQWPAWGQYFETKGEAGEPIDLPEAKELMAAYEAWMRAPDEAGREAAWQDILAINADQVFTIGLIAGVYQPIARDEKLLGVPEEAIWNWEPGAQFGIYLPDTFWYPPS
jgi:peptide/nickel transport system substrate-binding protein